MDNDQDGKFEFPPATQAERDRAERVGQQLKRDRASFWIRAGLQRARARGTRLGRPPALKPVMRQIALGYLAQGVPIRSVAGTLGVGVATIARIKASGERLEGEPLQAVLFTGRKRQAKRKRAD